MRLGCFLLAALAVAFTFDREASLRLSSPAFAPGGAIPKRFTCDGENLSPPLRWTRPPAGTRSFAILLDDPDASGGTFTHWIAWNVAPRTRSLATGRRAPADGTNSAGRRGYLGPCPPSGTHRYVFRLYALRAQLGLRAGADKAAFQRALRGRIIVSARLVGTYRR